MSLEGYGRGRGGASAARGGGEPVARALVAAAMLLAAAPSRAQFPQYTPPGALAEPRPSTRESVEAGVREARWRLGRARIDPRLRIRDAAWVKNVFASADGAEEVSDLTATLSAGLVSYLRLGPGVIVSALALPEYTWWRREQELRELNGIYGLGLFGYFNRLTVEVEGRSAERQRPLNSELELPVEIADDRAELKLEADLAGRLALFGALRRQELDHGGEAGNRVPGLQLAALDRVEEVASVGIEYRFDRGFSIGLGAERSRADFRVKTEGRSNSGTGPLLRLGYRAARAEVELTAVYRSLEFDDSSAIDEFEDLTGTARLVWELARRWRLTVYGARNAVYSAVDPDSFFTEERVGLALGSPPDRRLGLQLFIESGAHDYAGASDGRVDDLSAIGGRVRLRLRPRLALLVGGTRTDLDSELASSDRSRSEVLVELELGGELLPW